MPTLKLIQNEIKRLEDRSASTGLSLEDLKMLEILIRSGKELLSAPSALTEPIKPDEPTLSDEEVLSGLLEKKDEHE